jgi:nicotinamidase-related amidase
VDNFKRSAKVINHNRQKIKKIWRTGDAHPLLHIGHGVSWMNAHGDSPSPFTRISSDEIDAGIWFARKPSRRDWFFKYAWELEKRGNKALIIWPEHGLAGTYGQCFFPDIDEAVRAWEAEMQTSAFTLWKGRNWNVEMYSPFHAEVPDPADPTTNLNTALLDEIDNSPGIKLLAGDALSHCFGDAILDIARYVPRRRLSDYFVLTDCTSPIDAVPGGPDFPAIGRAILAEVESLGMRLTTSEEFLN